MFSYSDKKTKKAVLELKADCLLENWQRSYRGKLAEINAVFVECERVFLAGKEEYPHFFDDDVLAIMFRDLASRLLVIAPEEFHPFIIERSQRNV